MAYASLAQCVADLEKNNQLRRIDFAIDPHLEMAALQRRAFRAGSPALLFTKPKGCRFPMLANLFGARERVNFIFRDGLEKIKNILRFKATPALALRQPRKLLGIGVSLFRSLPIKSPFYTKKIPCLACECSIKDLPQLVSWPGDGGPFITLPLVLSANPANGSRNLGMYRIQQGGNDYGEREIGLHYQLHRGIGVHHGEAIKRHMKLPVHVHVGGPPELTLAAVMPMPEDMSELLFASMLGNQRQKLAQPPGFDLPCLAEADFLIRGQIGPINKPEGPFGDHLGYYSLKHEFPVIEVTSVHHRRDAIWPFTSVGRPPQEDTVFGDFIHELTAPLVSRVFPGIKEIHAVDAAGVHPLLLALGREKYTPWEMARKPRELLTLAMHLLGLTQTSLAKYLFIGAAEDEPGLSVRNVRGFLAHILERTNFASDLHFLTAHNCDTLDYSGGLLNEGSKLIWASAGPRRRDLGNELSGNLQLPPGFSRPLLVMPGVLSINAPAHNLPPNTPDPLFEQEFCAALANWTKADNFPMIVLADDSGFVSENLENFLWITFTRSDPATDIYGACASIQAKHWRCQAPLVIDARSKKFHAPELVEDPAIVTRLEALAAKNGPLAGII